MGSWRRPSTEQGLDEEEAFVVGFLEGYRLDSSRIWCRAKSPCIKGSGGASLSTFTLLGDE